LDLEGFHFSGKGVNQDLSLIKQGGDPLSTTLLEFVQFARL
jgi:hypothetical protein